MCGWTTRRLANSAIAMIGRARHRRIKKRRRYERSAGTEPVLPVVIFPPPLSSNFSMQRIGRPTFLLILFAPLLKGEVKQGGSPPETLTTTTTTSEHNEIHHHCHIHCHYNYHTCHCHYYNDWNSDKTKKIWKNHGKPIYRLALKTLLKKPFSFGLAYAVKKKWRKKFY